MEFLYMPKYTISVSVGGSYEYDIVAPDEIAAMSEAEDRAKVDYEELGLTDPTFDSEVLDETEEEDDMLDEETTDEVTDEGDEEDTDEGLMA
jgi:hypothetical protein